MSGLDNRRKHRKQMSPIEIASVESLVRAQDAWNIGRHARDRMAAKGVTEAQVIEVLATGYAVEVNRVNDLCAVFRKEYGRYAVCVVVSLATHFVVSVWKNGARDKHSTLDITKYQWNADMSVVMGAFAQETNA